MSSTSREEHSSDTGKPWALISQGYFHSRPCRSVTGSTAMEIAPCCWQTREKGMMWVKPPDSMNTGPKYSHFQEKHMHMEILCTTSLFPHFLLMNRNHNSYEFPMKLTELKVILDSASSVSRAPSLQLWGGCISLERMRFKMISVFLLSPIHWVQYHTVILWITHTQN